MYTLSQRKFVQLSPPKKKCMMDLSVQMRRYKLIIILKTTNKILMTHRTLAVTASVTLYCSSAVCLPLLYWLLRRFYPRIRWKVISLSRRVLNKLPPWKSVKSKKCFPTFFKIFENNFRKLRKFYDVVGILPAILGSVPTAQKRSLHRLTGDDDKNTGYDDGWLNTWIPTKCKFVEI